MDHILTEYGLRLTYLRDPNVIDDLDQDRILEDLSDDTPDGDPLPWLTRYRLADYDHLVLVTDRSSGRYLAFLAGNDGATARENFLLLETAFVTSVARGQNLMRRMIALAMLRIGGLGPLPSVIVACTRNPACYRIMRDIARRFTGAALFPDLDSVAINFHSATLAQRVAREIYPHSHLQASTGTIRDAAAPAGTNLRRPLSSDEQIDSLFGQQMQTADRMLAVVDLRSADEAIILEDARRIYRSSNSARPLRKQWRALRTAAGTTDAPSRGQTSFTLAARS
jgi:hypothetical protein